MRKKVKWSKKDGLDEQLVGKRKPRRNAGTENGKKHFGSERKKVF